VEEISNQDYASVLERALDDLAAKHGMSRFEAVGHRFVHGGPRLRDHFIWNQQAEQELEAAIDYAPLHMPAALAVLRSVKRKMPDVPQVVCIDTAFHRHLPDVSQTLALPAAVRELGVERYGFHGLSLESIVAQFSRVPARLIVAHLGNGASVSAIRDGGSIDTSMGMTPTGGFLMGTRCGDIDPGVLIYLLRHGYSAEDLERVCDRESGLRGISGITSDVRKLVAERANNPNADLALRMLCYQVRKTIAGMAAALGGVETLVFSGGIGEHATEVRNEIVSGLGFLGAFELKVLPSREDEQIAKNTARLLHLVPE
jgi:acetate kinase